MLLFYISWLTKLQKLYSPFWNLSAGNQSLTLLLKKLLSTNNLSPMNKIFIERPDVYNRTLPTGFYIQWRSSVYITYIMCPSAWVARNPLVMTGRAHCFCEIWALCMSWVCAICIIFVICLNLKGRFSLGQTLT